MSTFAERKAKRTANYMTKVYGWKLVPCRACNGSGYYDAKGNPKCWACNGTGKEKTAPHS